MIHPREWMEVRPGGLYCKPGGFFIDPTRRVPVAVITHGHSDHARAGHAKAIATPDTLAIMACRYGERFAGGQAGLPYGQAIHLGDARVTLHPAGHILGSAQVLIEYGGARIVISGDYKRTPDPTAREFEPIACDVFVTEATFGLPVFCHPDPRHEIEKLLASLAVFPESCHTVGCYALGKTQRLMAELRRAGYDKPIYLHGALIPLTRLYEERGVALGPYAPVTPDNCKALAGEIVLCPPSALPAVGWKRSPTRSEPPLPAGCRSAPAPGSRASSCRWSSPITAIGPSLSKPSTKLARAKSGPGMGAKKPLFIIAGKRGSRRARCRCFAPKTAKAGKAEPNCILLQASNKSFAKIGCRRVPVQLWVAVKALYKYTTISGALVAYVCSASSVPGKFPIGE